MGTVYRMQLGTDYDVNHLAVLGRMTSVRTRLPVSRMDCADTTMSVGSAVSAASDSE
jgi:hypothetical protein